MTFLNRRLFDNVSVFVDSLSGANRVAFDVSKPNGTITLDISGNISADNLKVGTGSPEGVVVGVKGDIYQRTDGSENSTLYIKESGSGNTGWTALGANSISGGISGQAAFWSGSNSISASNLIVDSDALLIVPQNQKDVFLGNNTKFHASTGVLTIGTTASTVNDALEVNGTTRSKRFYSSISSNNLPASQIYVDNTNSTTALDIKAMGNSNGGITDWAQSIVLESSTAGSSGGLVLSAFTGDIVLQTNGRTSAVRVNSAGISASNTVSGQNIRSRSLPTTAAGNFLSWDSSGNLIDSGYNSSSFSGSGSSSLAGGVPGKFAVWSATNNISASSQMRETNGRVTIAATDDGVSQLKVAGETTLEYLDLINSSGNYGWQISSANDGFYNGDLGIYERQAGTRRLIIKRDTGNVLIGTSTDTSSARLQVSGLIASSSLTNSRVPFTTGGVINDSPSLRFVAAAGSGLFVGDGTGGRYYVLDGGAAQERGLLIRTAGSNRWQLLASTQAEAGSNAGSNLQIAAYNDSGNTIDIPLTINRGPSGTIELARPVLINSTTNFGSNYKLQVNGDVVITATTGARYTWNNSGNYLNWIESGGIANNNYMRFACGNTEVMRLRNLTGPGTTVLIGTTADVTGRLQVGGDVYSTGIFVTDVAGDAVILRNSGSNNNIVSAVNLNLHADKWNQYSASFSNITFSTNGTEKARVSDNGNVLIGTTTDNSSGVLQVNGSGFFGGKLRVNPGATSVVSEAVRITSGLGAVNAGTSIDWWHTTGAANLAAYARIAGVTDSAGTGGVLSFYTSPSFGTESSERMRVTETGDVLIGSTTDIGSYKLQVTGSGYMSNGLYVGTSATTANAGVYIFGAGTPSSRFLVSQASSASPVINSEIIAANDSSVNGGSGSTVCGFRWSHAANNYNTILQAYVYSGGAAVFDAQQWTPTNVLIRVNDVDRVNITSASLSGNLTGIFHSTGSGGGMRIGQWAVDSNYGHIQNHTLSTGDAGAYALLQNNSGATFVNASSGQPLSFRIGNSEKMLLQSTGNVLINGNPGGSDIFKVNGNITLTTQVNSYPGSGNPMELVNRSSGPIDLYPANSFAARLSTGGRTLLGTTADNGIDRLQVSGSAGISGVLSANNIKRGTGSPEGVTAGNVGDVYQRVDGAAGTSVYIKESGTGNTGWVGISAGSSGGSSLSGGTSGRLAVWSGTNSISASNKIIEDTNGVSVTGVVNSSSSHTILDSYTGTAVFQHSFTSQTSAVSDRKGLVLRDNKVQAGSGVSECGIRWGHVGNSYINTLQLYVNTASDNIQADSAIFSYNNIYLKTADVIRIHTSTTALSANLPFYTTGGGNTVSNPGIMLNNDRMISFRDSNNNTTRAGFLYMDSSDRLRLGTLNTSMVCVTTAGNMLVYSGTAVQPNHNEKLQVVGGTYTSEKLTVDGFNLSISPRITFENSFDGWTNNNITVRQNNFAFGFNSVDRYNLSDEGVISINGTKTLSGSVPGSGSMYFEKTSNSFIIKTGGDEGGANQDSGLCTVPVIRYKTCGLKIINNTAGIINLSTVNDAISATGPFFNGALGQREVPYHFWKPGKILKHESYGSIQNTGTPTLLFRLIENNTSNVVWTTAATTMTTITGIRDYEATAELKCISITSTGANLIASGRFKYGTGANASATINVADNTVKTVRLDTRQDWTLQVQFSAASTSNGITAHNYVLTEM